MRRHHFFSRKVSLKNGIIAYFMQGVNAHRDLSVQFWRTLRELHMEICDSVAEKSCLLVCSLQATAENYSKQQRTGRAFRTSLCWNFDWNPASSSPCSWHAAGEERDLLIESRE